MKNILILIDDLNNKNRPITLTYLLQKIGNTNKIPLNLIDNKQNISANIYDFSQFDSFDLISKYNSILLVYTGKPNMYDLINLVNYNNNYYNLPLFYMANEDLNNTGNLNANRITSIKDVDILLQLTMQLPVPLISEERVQAIELGDVNNIDKLVYEFQNRMLSYDQWTYNNQMKIIKYAIDKYGLENSTRIDGWLMINWKKFIYSMVNLGYNNYWHYSLLRFYAIMISKGILPNDKLTEKYYDKNVLYSPYARDFWIPPNKIKLN
jgi:hypothetical protein